MCINRVHAVDSKKRHHAAAIKCEPKCEKCDKHMCTHVKELCSKSDYCKWNDSPANEDRVDVDCDKLDNSIQFLGRRYNYDSLFSDSSSDDSKDSKRKSKSNESRSESNNVDSKSSSRAFSASISSDIKSKSKKIQVTRTKVQKVATAAGV